MGRIPDRPILQSVRCWTLPGDDPLWWPEAARSFGYITKLTHMYAISYAGGWHTDCVPAVVRSPGQVTGSNHLCDDQQLLIRLVVRSNTRRIR